MPSAEPLSLLIVSANASRLVRGLSRLGHVVRVVTAERALDAIDESVEAVILDVPARTALALSRRVKTRHQLPLLPVIVARRRPRAPSSEPGAPDAWLSPTTTPRELATRAEELVRIRRTEREMARLSSALASLAAENGRLYERARRDADSTLALLRELQHRVRNNLAAIQALLVLERHRRPPRELGEAIDVAIARLRGMAALQDAVSAEAGNIGLATLARSIARAVLDVFGRTDTVSCDVTGDAAVPARVGSSVAIALNELVMNAVKHAEATRVGVTIATTDGAVTLAVVDDGRGIPDPVPEGSGLVIARTVVRNELNGTLALGHREHGTEARIAFPIPTTTTDFGLRTQTHAGRSRSPQSVVRSP